MSLWFKLGQGVGCVVGAGQAIGEASWQRIADQAAGDKPGILHDVASGFDCGRRTVRYELGGRLGVQVDDPQVAAWLEEQAQRRQLAKELHCALDDERVTEALKRRALAAMAAAHPGLSPEQTSTPAVDETATVAQAA